MQRKSDADIIDAENLFTQWHPDVRKFTANIDKECALVLIKNTKVSSFDTSKFYEVLNLTNTKQCRLILDRILKEENTTNFFNILKERDRLHPREIDREHSIEQLFKSVKEDNYYPLLFLELNKKYYIIDGRTRFYCCLFSKVPAKVRIISDYKLNETCKY